MANNVETRLRNLEVAAGPAVDEAAWACLVEAETQPEYLDVVAKHGPTLETIYTKPRTEQLTQEETLALSLAWDALWDGALRLAEERGISWERVHAAEFAQRQRAGKA